MFELREEEKIIRWYEYLIQYENESAKEDWENGLKEIEDIESFLDEYLNALTERFIDAQDYCLVLFFDCKSFFDIYRKKELIFTKIKIKNYTKKMEKIKQKLKRVAKIKQRYYQFKYFCNN